MAVTEIGWMRAKPGLDIMNQSTPEGRIINAIWETVITKPGGPSRLYWGLEKDQPSRVWSFFDWSSVEQHRTFAKEHGEEAVKDFPKICDFEESSKHVSMVPSSDVLMAPLTEVFVTYFRADISEDDKDRVSGQLQARLTDTFENSLGVTGFAHGWGLENDFVVKGEEGKSGTALMAFVGWSNLDVNKDFHEKDAYKDFVVEMRSMDGTSGFYGFTSTLYKAVRENLGPSML